MIYWILIVAMILIDRLVKYWAVTSLKPIGSIPLIQDVFHLTFAKNTGAAFSILRGKQIFLVVLTSLVIVGLTFLMAKNIKNGGNKMMTLSLALIIGGAIGNFIDRVRLDYVIDYLNFTLINFPIFNAADVFIVVGTGLLAILVIFFNIEMPDFK
ncbi:signal peptidase II [Fusibacter sp. JL216-2]|uniref:signal peptidase II n=1 Tax=Fusibacter sp. JL216-2 TaxID=3071453 RepID=UPI003D355D02